jgi:hypothetical protein
VSAATVQYALLVLAGLAVAVALDVVCREWRRHRQGQGGQGMARPPAVEPAGVRLHLADGTVQPVGLVYAGWDATHEMHVWEVAVSDLTILSYLSTGIVKLHIDELPARTTVQLPLATKETHNGH